jgi:hypothetical protein
MVQELAYAIDASTGWVLAAACIITYQYVLNQDANTASVQAEFIVV